MGESNTWGPHRYRVLSARAVTPVIRELWLTPLDAPLSYRAGEYVLLGDVDWRVPQRSYSVANAPRDDGQICMLVTLVAGGPTSTWAHGLNDGDEVLLEGPFGTFVSAPAHQGAVLLLGAGSGLAPLHALAEDLLAHKPGRQVTLFFSCRTPADLINDAAYKSWQAGHSNFRYLATLTQEQSGPWHGRIPPLLGKAVGDLTGWEVFASGPSGFVVGCAAAAQALGAAATDIRTEEFFTDPVPWMGTMPPLPRKPGAPS